MLDKETNRLLRYTIFFYTLLIFDRVNLYIVGISVLVRKWILELENEEIYEEKLIRITSLSN